MRTFPLDALLRALLIAATGVMLLFKVFTGALPLYVHVRYTPLITGTGVVLVLLGVVALVMALRGREHHHAEGGGASWRSPAIVALLVPVLLGLLVPSKALGSSALDTRGIGGTSGAGIRTVESIAGVQTLGLPDPTRWTMLDWVNGLTYQPDNPALQGQPIELTGFVWRPEDYGEGYFVISRFVTSCCTADSLAIGLPVQWAGSSGLARDSWVRVRGTVSLAQLAGEEVAIIVADEVIPIEQPAEPYIYP